ncbi:MAG: LON peptidase substrate-binding domain-containing protein [Pseudomonadota bacterium]
MRHFSLADLPQTISVFPLGGALLLPRARLPLNIFEPRYLAMLEDAMKTPERLIGMIQPLESGRRMHQIGCAGRITSFTETEDGRYLITLGGVCRFRLGKEEEGFSPYRRFTVDWSSFERDLGASEEDPGLDRERFLDLLARYFETARLSSDWDALKSADAELLINSLSVLCPFEVEEKQALLEAPSLETRRETLVMLMEFALRGGAGSEGALQ